MDQRPAPVSVVVVEDHALVADGLLALLAEEASVRVVASASTAAEALALVEEARPQVVLMDVRLPDADGIDVAVRIKTNWPDVEIVVLTGLMDDTTLSRAVEAGCSGFLTKNQRIEDVVDAIVLAARGETTIAAGDLARVLSRMTRHPRPRVGVRPRLSDREAEVLGLLAAGMSTEGMAERLSLSPHTVRNHVRNILTKLGAHSKLEALSVAVRSGLVSMDGM
ncbi:MAG: response regulator transcription factor [Actinomycetota bacterium]|jgi:DNA-binding NarL/FixJ family response regulator|nr:response regulator transcription factor [Actinomycetota bacterium]